VKTIFASLWYCCPRYCSAQVELDTLTFRHSAAAFRMILTPIDTLKTTLQAQGPKGTPLLRQRIKEHGLGTLWWGAFATAGATFVGHYPWFGTVGSQHRPLDYPPPY